VNPVRDEAGTGSLDDEARRREWREFVREHHPDRGGDPEVFAAGVRAYREGRRPMQAATHAEQYLTTHRSPRGFGHVTHWVRRRWDGWTRPPRVE
jgi:curved DNA-binding protein CbpA